MVNKLIAYGLGILCHLAFFVAIGSMAYMLATGLTSGILPIGGPYGRLTNILLLIQFPVLHSFFLTPMGKKILVSPFPKEIARDLLTTAYALVSSIQLLAVFVFWTPARNAWFVPPDPIFFPWVLVYGISWIVLMKALAEAGMAMHTGALGWRSVVTGKQPVYPRIPTAGLHSQCRHPIYLAFSLIILTAPIWSFDHVMLASIWVLYCLIGPKFKERRIQERSREQYDKIKQSTPYLIPRGLKMSSYFRQSGRDE